MTNKKTTNNRYRNTHTNDLSANQPKARRGLRSFFVNMKAIDRDRMSPAAKATEKVNAWTLFWFPILYVYLEVLLRLCTKTPFFTRLFYPVAFAIAFGLLLSGLVHLCGTKVIRVISIILTCASAFLYGMMIIIYNSYGSFMSLNTIKTTGTHVVGSFFKMMMLAILSNWYVVLLAVLPMVFYIFSSARLKRFRNKRAAQKEAVKKAFGKGLFRPSRYKWPMALVLVVLSLVIFGITTFVAAVGPAKNKYNKQYNFSTAVQTFGLTCAIRLDWAYAGRTISFEPVDSTTATTASAEAETGTDTSAEGGETSDAETTTEAVKMLGQNIMSIDFSALSSDNETWNTLDSYVQTLAASDKNEYTGIFEGKNLILITAEAFWGGFVNQDLTPALYRLMHNGFYFSDYYQPAWGGSTITGELSHILGLVPTHEVDTIYQTIGHNNYFTLGNQLQRLGYYNIAYHAGDYDYYERQTTHENLGYGTWLGIGNGLEDITNAWPGDALTVDATMDTYINKTPFSIYYMTVSGHCTYDADDYKVDKFYDQVNAYYPNLMETTKYYICYQMEFEESLQIMLNKLEAAGIADDTVIVITTDHYPYGLCDGSFGNTEDYLSDLYGGDSTGDWLRDKNALIIWSGCLENEYKDMAVEISTPVSSLDILPTVSNLFGLEYDSRMLVGRDVFSNQEPLVFWLSYSWKTEVGLYNSYYDKFTFSEGYSMSDEDLQAYIARIDQTITNKIHYSDMAISSDYFYHLFGPDTDTSSNDR